MQLRLITGLGQGFASKIVPYSPNCLQMIRYKRRKTSKASWQPLMRREEREANGLCKVAGLLVIATSGEQMA